MRRLLCGVMLCGFVPYLPGRQAADPRDGREVLARMHQAYAGRWYSKVAFVQRTTVIKPGGQQDTATWYESLLGPNQLRIDFGSPAAGRGAIFTAESTFIFREGRLLRSNDQGNPFLPLVMGVFLESPDTAARRAMHHGFDLQKLHVSATDGGRFYVVGSASDADTTSPQFWVDARRWLVTRMIVWVQTPSAGKLLLDVRLGDDVPISGGWLSTRVSIARDGAPLQLEEYTEWSDRVAIPDSLFDRTRWVSRGHWASEPRSPALWGHAP